MLPCALCTACRSQLLRAVQLLPRHIASLSERMGYMRKLLGLESLGALERLELVARLLLDVREALAGRPAKLHIPPSRASMAARYRPGYETGSSAYPFYVWEATLYGVQEEGEQLRDRPQGAIEQRRQASNTALWTEWSEVMRLFIMTAAQVGSQAGAAVVGALCSTRMLMLSRRSTLHCCAWSGVGVGVGVQCLWVWVWVWVSPSCDTTLPYGPPCDYVFIYFTYFTYFILFIYFIFIFIFYFIYFILLLLLLFYVFLFLFLLRIFFHMWLMLG
jgi:hypothetical protein